MSGKDDELEQWAQLARDAVEGVDQVARSILFGDSGPSLKEREVAALEQIAENGKKK